MIFRPKPGQRVRLHYAERARAVMPFHGREGEIETVAAHRGGPVNVAVRLDSGGTVVVPRGNIQPVRS